MVKSQSGNGTLLGCICFLVSFINEQIYLDATKLWYSIISVMQTKYAAPEIFLVALPNALTNTVKKQHQEHSHKV